jgi:hypothetical protein
LGGYPNVVCVSGLAVALNAENGCHAKAVKWSRGCRVIEVVLIVFKQIQVLQVAQLKRERRETDALP